MPCSSAAQRIPSGQFAQTIHQVFLVQLFLASDLLSGWRGRASIPVRSRGGPQIRRWSASAESWPTNLPRDPNSPSPPLPLQPLSSPSTQEAHEAPGNCLRLTCFVSAPLHLPTKPLPKLESHSLANPPPCPKNLSPWTPRQLLVASASRVPGPSTSLQHVTSAPATSVLQALKRRQLTSPLEQKTRVHHFRCALQQCGPLDRLPGRPSLSTEQQPPGHRRPARDQHLGASRHAQPPISSSPRITSSARRRTRLLPSPKCATSTAPHLVRSSRLGPFGQGRFLRPEHPWQSTLWFANKLLFASCKDVGMVTHRKRSGR